MSRHLTIQPKGDKGRAFSAEMLSYATADALWNHADTRVTRPLWAVFAGPSEALRAFVENLRLGNVASVGLERGAERFEFQRSVPFRWWTRPLPAGGSVTSVAHPSLLSWRAPVEDDYRYRFMVLPSVRWLGNQRFDQDRASRLLDRLIRSSERDGIAVEHGRYDPVLNDYVRKSKIRVEVQDHNGRIVAEPLQDLLGYGALLLHYLDHRLPLPIPRDPVFGAWLLLVSQYGNGPAHMATRSSVYDRGAGAIGYVVHEPGAAGCAPGFVFSAQKNDLPGVSKWIAREVSRWATVGGM